jgi:hypothetical protein
MMHQSIPMICLCLLLQIGCMPATPPPTVNGPLDSNKATQLQSKIRSNHGEKFSVDHKVGDKSFTANWEISNSLKKNTQLQIKPPREGWELPDLYAALDVILTAYDTKPWYGTIDETVLRLMSAASKDPEGFAEDVAPETPYRVSVKVKEHSSEWFLQVKVQILNEDGSSIGI